MADQKRILFTGGSGLLGTAFRKLRPEVEFPASREFNITDLSQMRAYVGGGRLDCVIHAAAFTSPPLVDKDPGKALDVNIVGTVNIVKLCMEHGSRLLYISTDYVFQGDKGLYREDDPVLPVNQYAWSKLGGECAVRLYAKSLIIRTTFGPDVFPYPKAFVDQWTSRESVSAIARKINRLVDLEATGIVHVGGERKTVYEYAKSLDPSKEIGRLSVHDVSFKVPIDTSLNCDRYKSLIEKTSN